MRQNRLVKFSLFIFSSALFFLYSLSAQAQKKKETVAADTLFRVIMTDGNAFIGEIVEMDIDKVILRSDKLGQITLHRKFIKSIERVKSLEIEYKNEWYVQLHSTRYLFAASAYGLEKGEAYYQNVLVFYNKFDVGITENFSIAFGTLPAFLLGGLPTPVWIAPQVSIPVVKEKINFSAGVLVGSVIGNNSGILLLPHVTATFGPRDKNISIKVGFIYVQGDIVPYPIINISGIIRIGRKTFLMMENHLVSEGEVLTGVAIIGAKSIMSNVALSYGLAIPLVFDTGEVYGFPWVGITIPISFNR